ncbi:MAG: hypothetical protein ABL952_16005 [Pyrinomonadaceae bacterium]
MKNKIFTLIAITVATLAFSISATAQNKKASMNARLFDLVQSVKQGKIRINTEMARQVREDFSEAETGSDHGNAPSIIGSWNCLIASSDTGLPAFEALQTFGAEGTFIETSSLLGMGGEGPAHGVYQRFKRGYVLTFELFVFDPATGESVGRVRVRASIRMTSPNDFTAATAVDFIEPDGTIILDIDGGPFRGTRLNLRGV